MHFNNLAIAPLLLAGAASALPQQMPLGDEATSQDVYSLAKLLDSVTQYLGKHDGASDSIYTATDKKLSAEVDCEGLPTTQEQNRCLKEGGIMVYADSHEQIKAQFCDADSDTEACYAHGGWAASSAKHNADKPKDVLDVKVHCEKLPTTQEQTRCLEEGGLKLHADHHKAMKAEVCELVSNKKDCYKYGGWIAAADAALDTQNAGAEDYCGMMGSEQEISRCISEGGYMVQADSHPKVKVTLCELLSTKEEMDACYAEGAWFPSSAKSQDIFTPSSKSKGHSKATKAKTHSKFEGGIGPLHYSFGSKLKFKYSP
ncbi:hypothetical protein ASPWEDRAFT_174127 [Aspergillus wentii DTO 134E9]|uniref:Uncharacterized protein n=1 Tax=Aspergillus wentii DTO 134E9 TaxID=1073089 RepID=A0A1L9RCL8_ASPWE|nr:uncharacterized protein ASPWEDRAFT_174127 [Aspergillus wentii DTO 134E9]KAI9924260.1 hypothetical protein MW887_007210 [Aspergillus wentii]OJJ32679.1 hypothetical protein ASPWEDRAFT_174127 [Aspergillus wentii DTO 134E9]